jgi:hypothetical protein
VAHVLKGPHHIAKWPFVTTVTGGNIKYYCSITKDTQLVSFFNFYTMIVHGVKSGN